MISIIGNERRQQLLKSLESTFSDAPITVAKMAALLNVSARTIRYDLDSIKDEIEAKGLVLHKKSRKGIWVERAKNNSISNKTTDNDYVFNRKERCEQIIITLLDEQKSSIDELADQLMVSRNTLLSDLKDVQETLKKRHLKYASKRGSGIWAYGSEQDIRDMFIHIFAKYTYDFRKFEPRAAVPFDMQKIFCQYAAKIPVQQIAMFFLNIVRQKGILENNMSINRMICALVVQLKRLQYGHRISSTKNVDFLSDEGEWLEKLSNEIAAGMKIYERSFCQKAEIQFIMKELLHSRIYLLENNAEQHLPNDSNLKAIDMAKSFIKYVQVWLGDIYIDDDELIYNLAMHLQPAIERAHCGIVLTNPLLMQIQTQYSNLFMVTRRAAEQLGEKMHIKLSEDEIGYLTIHLGAAVERHKIRRVKKLSVLLVCGNGVGTANLLATTLKSRMPYIYIKKILSLYKLDEQNFDDIDIIISTVSLEIPGKAVLRVSPILTEAEIGIIEGQIRYFYNKKIMPDPANSLPIPQKPGLAALLTENMISIGAEAADWQDAIRKAGELLVNAGAVTNNYVAKMVQCINDFGPYIIVCPGVAMPHARFEDGAKKVAVSFLRLKKAVYFEKGGEKPVDMVFAFSTINEKDHLHMMLDLWKIFMDKKALNQLRNCKTKSEILKFIKEFLQ